MCVHVVMGIFIELFVSGCVPNLLVSLILYIIHITFNGFINIIHITFNGFIKIPIISNMCSDFRLNNSWKFFFVLFWNQIKIELLNYDTAMSVCLLLASKNVMLQLLHINFG